jgi:hypothetical protein
MYLGHGLLGSNYNGLQARIDRRFSSGFEWMTNFTWSKGMDDGRYANQVMNQFNLHGEWGPSSEDRTLASTSSFVYQLPFGPGKQFASNAKGVVGHVVGGWQLSGIVGLATGRPFTVDQASNTTLNSPMDQRPNRIASGKLTNPTRNMWFDPTAFVNPTQPYTYGNAARDLLDGPGWAEIDLGLHKSFKLTERFNLQFRWEAFNVFNRTNLATPDATVGTQTVGMITSTETPMRRQQIGLRLMW